MEPSTSILGSFIPGSGEDGEPGNGEDGRCNKNEMNPVYFNRLACMCVLHVGDTFSYHLQEIILRLFCCFMRCNSLEFRFITGLPVQVACGIHSHWGLLFIIYWELLSLSFVTNSKHCFPHLLFSYSIVFIHVHYLK